MEINILKYPDELTTDITSLPSDHSRPSVTGILSVLSIEEQLLDLESNHYKHKLTQEYWLGGSSILTLSIIATVIYFTQGIIRRNCKTCNNKNLNIKENQEEVELTTRTARR